MNLPALIRSWQQDVYMSLTILGCTVNCRFRFADCPLIHCVCATDWRFLQRLVFLLFSIEFEKTCIRLKQKLIFLSGIFLFCSTKSNHYPVTTRKFSRGLVTQALQLFGPWKVGPTEPWSHVQVANGLSPDCSSGRNIVTYKQMERILEGRWTLAFCQVCAGRCAALAIALNRLWNLGLLVPQTVGPRTTKLDLS